MIMTSRRKASVAGVFALACTLFAGAAPAGAATTIPSTFDLVNYISHYCVGITNGANNALAIQWGTPNNQLWVPHPYA